MNNVQVLAIGPAERLAIEEVIRFAEANRLPYKMLLKIVGQPQGTLPVGAVKGHVVLIPYGFRAVYSIEEQAEPLGWCRHISISHRGGYPIPQAAEEIIREFGYVLPLGDLFVFGEEEGGKKTAINLIEPLDRPVERMAELRKGEVVLDEQPPGNATNN